jgi:hypothetical protein
MLKAVKKLSHNKKNHCNIRVDIIREGCDNATMSGFVDPIRGLHLSWSL